MLLCSQLNQKEVTLSCSMQGFNAAMKSLEDTMTRGLHSQREQSEALGLLVSVVFHWQRLVTPWSRRETIARTSLRNLIGTKDEINLSRCLRTAKSLCPNTELYFPASTTCRNGVHRFEFCVGTPAVCRLTDRFRFFNLKAAVGASSIMVGGKITSAAGWEDRCLRFGKGEIVATRFYVQDIPPTHPCKAELCLHITQRTAFVWTKFSRILLANYVSLGIASMPIQDLDNRLQETQRLVEHLENKVDPSSLSVSSVVCGGCGGLVARALAFHQEDPGSLTGGVAPGFSLVGIVSDDAAGRRIFSGVSPRPCHAFPPQLHTHLASSSSAGMKGWEKRETPEKARQPGKSSDTIPDCKNSGVTRPGIEPGPPLVGGEQSNRSATVASVSIEETHNNYFEAYNKTVRYRDCSHPHLQEITELVRLTREYLLYIIWKKMTRTNEHHPVETHPKTVPLKNLKLIFGHRCPGAHTCVWFQVMDFNKHRNWTQLRIGLEAVLDHKSDVYGQLQYSLHFSNSQIFWIGFYGHTQLASILLCGGLSVDIDEPASDTMLHGAAEQGHVSLVKLLLDFGADINRRGISGMTPIMRAASWGKLEMVKVLFKAGADTTIKDSIGRTALQWAKTREKAEVVKILQQLPH
ncbi:hypothetical protein PR048_022528 [Dryococelus australis]|uniref:Uncharacterized protein n=1 Tax=Dryococelus australis TaxID=614101 RepID=A0ABQ9H1C2_9NEOP|nr:hypothetical protein PR048_022528 [Dryococelus australis]